MSKIVTTIGILIALAATVPSAPAAVQSEKLSRKELKALIASAKTPSDHERISAYYRREAQELEAKHKEHQEDLAEYNKNPSRYPGKYPTMGDHCRNLASYYKMAAEKASSLADLHARLAQESR